MDMNSVYLCVLLIGLLFDSGHSYYSPCPDVLDFYREGTTVYGRITVQPKEVVSSLNIRLNYSLPTSLDDDYLGNLKAPDDVLLKYNRGETVHYRVHLPLVMPWPKVTEITINGNAICTGPGDQPRPNKVLSSLSISQTSYYGTYGGPPPYRRFTHEPQMTPQPKPEPIPQIPASHSIFDDNEYIKKFVMQHFGTSNGFANTVAVTQQTTTARPTTTTPVYVEPVTMKPRPVQDISNTWTTTTDCGLVDGDNGIRPLIHNGLSYDRGDIPWLVAIYKITKKALNVICGGTLVSDRHVITAAHCMYRRTQTAVKDIVIKVGVHELDDWSDDLAVITKPIAADIPETFNSSTLENDIMVLTLDKRINFNNYIRPACLWSGNTELSRIVGNTGVVAGWGGINKYNSVPLDVPQMVRVPIVSTKECRASKSIFHKLTSDYTMCAGSRNGDGPCQGDSGGGLYLKEGGKWRIRGVVSVSTENEDLDTAKPCNLNEYVVYTDTAQYLPWIKSILSKNHFD